MMFSRGIQLAFALAMVSAGAASAQVASVSVTKAASPSPVAADSDLVYTISIANEGPDPAQDLTLTDTVPPGTSFVSLATPPGWSCTTPSVGSGGTVDCSLASFPVGGGDITLIVHVAGATPDGTVLTNTATVASTTPDPESSDNSGSVETTVLAPTPLGLTLTKVDAADPVTVGEDLGYTLTLALDFPDAIAATLADTLPAGTTFVSFVAPAGWSCATPTVGGTGTVNCSIASPVSGDHVFSLVVNVDSLLPSGTVLHNHASATADDDAGHSLAAEDDEDTTVLSPAAVAATKTAAGSFAAGQPVTYAVTLSNAGPGEQPDAAGDELTDVLPSVLSLVSASATSGTAVADAGTNTVTWNGALPAGGSVTVTISAVLSTAAAPGSTVANQGSILFDTAGDGTNGGSGVTDDPATAADDDPTSFVVAAPQLVEVPAIGGRGLGIFAAALAAAAVLLLRVFRSAVGE